MGGLSKEQHQRHVLGVPVALLRLRAVPVQRALSVIDHASDPDRSFDRLEF